MTAVELGMPDRIPPVSNSELGTFRDCRRKWMLAHYYRLALKRDRPQASALSLGSKVHEALEHYYGSGVPLLDTLERVFAEDFAALDAWEYESGYVDHDARLALQKEREMGTAMLEGYLSWIEETGADEGLQVTGVEAVIEAASGVPGVRIRGKLDQRIYRTFDGARLFLDFKTTGSVTEPARTLPIDEQTKMYQLLERLDAIAKSGNAPPEPTQGGLYRMLKKVKRTERAKPPFYDTIEIHHNDETLRSMWLRINRMIEEMMQIREALDAGGDHRYWAYPRPSRDCTWKCDFFAVCAMMDDGSDWHRMLEDYYEAHDPYARYNTEEKKDSDRTS